MIINGGKEESEWNKSKTFVKIVDIDKIISINNLHVNSLNVPINRQDIQSILTKYLLHAIYDKPLLTMMSQIS